MQITQGVISRDEAIRLAPDYVKFIEGDYGSSSRHILFDVVLPKFETLKRGQKVLTFVDGVFVCCKVSSIKSDDYRAIDGPVVRVSNGECSWRVDGDRYAYPI